MPAPPSAAEQKANVDAYRQSSKDLDSRVELSGQSAKELEMTLERFLASLYMSAMLQLGMMHEQGGQPRIDLIGARQTIDTLSLLQEKTKGNLTRRKRASCRTVCTNCAWPMWKSPMHWHVHLRPREPLQVARNDEGNAHRAGQRHVDGRAHHRLHLRRVSFTDPRDAARALPS